MANDSRSGAVAARKRALEKVRKRTEEREAKTGDAIVGAEVALEARAAAQVAVRVADDEWRAEVQKLVDLSWSLEEIADLVGVDVSEVRRARLQRAAAAEEEVVVDDPSPARSSTRSERSAAGTGRTARGRSGADAAAADPAAGGASGSGELVDPAPDGQPVEEPVPVG